MSLQQVNRSYLFASLNRENMPRLFVITAPAGCGKTILAQQLIEFINCPSVWHTVDMWQKDATRLQHTSCIHWQQYEPNLTIPESYGSVTGLARALAQAIKETIREPILYILDDIHHLHQSKDAELWLQTLLDICPPNVHFVFVGRSVPIVDWYREIGRGNVFSINKSNLQFTPDDLVQMTDISQVEAEALVKRYHGWAAAIRLAIDPSMKQSAQHTLKTDTPEESLFQQLAAEYYRQLSLDHQHTLLVSSTTEDISLHMYQEMFSLSSLGKELEVLHTQHLLITETATGYRYHALFREFLQQHLREIQPDYYHHLHLKVGQWYEKHDKLELAIIHYLEADASSQAVRLAEDAANELLTRGLRQTLLKINDLLAHTDAPRIRLMSSVVLTDANRLQESNEQLARAETVFRKRGDVQRLAAVTLQGAFNQQQCGHYIEAIEQTRIVSEQSLPLIMKAWAKRILGNAYLGLGQYAEAIVALQKSTQIYASEGSGYEQAQALQDLSEAYIRSGQFTDGISILQEVIAISYKGDNIIVLAFALNNLGSAFHYTSQYEDALATLEQAKMILPDIHSRAAAYVYHSLGDLYRDLGKFIAAEHAYEIAYRVAQSEDKTLLRRISISRCHMAFWQEQPYEALQWILSVDIPPISRNLDDRVLHMWRELLAIWQHPQKSSIESLQHHITHLLEAHAIKPLSKIMGTLGYIAIKHQVQPLQDIFRTVIGQLSEGFMQTFVADCYYLPSLRQAIQSDPNLWSLIDKSYQRLTDHIQVNREGIDKIHTRQIELKMLGQDRVIFEGTVLPNGTWASPQARSFFYCLIFHGEQNKEQLTKHLWHEHSDYQARNALREVRQRIKEILPEVVIHEDNFYRLNPAFMMTMDVSKFQNSVYRASQLPERDARTEFLYLRALSLYEAGGDGGLLPHLYMDWLQVLRLKYEKLYIDALQGAARCAYVRRDFTYAIHHYEKSLLINPYDEAVYQNIMRCYADNKQLAQVQLIYNRLYTLLLDELDVVPHIETTGLLNRLLI